MGSPAKADAPTWSQGMAASILEADKLSAQARCGRSLPETEPPSLATHGSTQRQGNEHRKEQKQDRDEQPVVKSPTNGHSVAQLNTSPVKAGGEISRARIESGTDKLMNKDALNSPSKLLDDSVEKKQSYLRADRAGKPPAYVKPPAKPTPVLSMGAEEWPDLAKASQIRSRGTSRLRNHSAARPVSQPGGTPARSQSQPRQISRGMQPRRDPLSIVWVCQECKERFTKQEFLIEHQEAEGHWSPTLECSRAFVRKCDLPIAGAGPSVSESKSSPSDADAVHAPEG